MGIRVFGMKLGEQFQESSLLFRRTVVDRDNLTVLLSDAADIGNINRCGIEALYAIADKLLVEQLRDCAVGRHEVMIPRIAPSLLSELSKDAAHCSLL